VIHKMNKFVGIQMQKSRAYTP